MIYHKFGQHLLIVAALFGGWAAPRADAETGLQVHRLTFQSGGRPITVEQFSPAVGHGRRAIIVLYGAGGMVFDIQEMRRVARRMVEAGDEAYIVRYFNRTGSIFAVDSNMQQNYEPWLATVRDSIGWVQQQHGSDAKVGLHGYSLGAFIAIAAASNNPRVGAVAERSGGIWNNEPERIGRLPAMLLIHGRRDRRVPYEKYGAPLLARVKQRAASWETRFYPEEGHVFTAPACTIVREQVAAFFARRLR